MGLPSPLCVPHFGVRLVRKIQNEAADDEHRRSLLANYQSALPEGRYGLPGILAKYRDQSIGRNHPVSLSLVTYLCRQKGTTVTSKPRRIRYSTLYEISRRGLSSLRTSSCLDRSTVSGAVQNTRLRLPSCSYPHVYRISCYGHERPHGC